MNSVTTILVDDESFARSFLRDVIESFVPQMSILGEARNVRSAVELITTVKPQVLLLDIDLGSGTAFDILDEVQKEVPRSEVLLVTAYSQFMGRAWDYGVRDYILKSSPVEEMAAKLQRAAQRFLDQGMPKIISQTDKVIPILHGRIVVPSGKEKVLLPIQQIMYLEGQSSQTALYAMRKQTRMSLMSYTLQEFENDLREFGFVRVHKSWVVNMEYVEGIVVEKRQIFLTFPGQKIPVGKEYRKNLPGL